jgi:hypothetical protein
MKTYPKPTREATTYPPPSKVRALPLLFVGRADSQGRMDQKTKASAIRLRVREDGRLSAIDTCARQDRDASNAGHHTERFATQLTWSHH